MQKRRRCLPPPLLSSVSRDQGLVTVFDRSIETEPSAPWVMVALFSTTFPLGVTIRSVLDVVSVVGNEGLVTVVSVVVVDWAQTAVDPKANGTASNNAVNFISISPIVVNE